MKRIVLVVAMPLVGCTRTLPPRSTPPVEMPQLAVDPGPVAPGKSRVIIDTVGEPARVYVQTGHAERKQKFTVYIDVYNREGGYLRTETKEGEIGASATVIEPLCKTPCAADLRPGTYTLHFEPDAIPDPAAISRDQATVDFGPTPTVYRRAVGTHPSLGASLGHGLVSAAWIGTGLVWAGVAGGFLASSPSTDDNLRVAGTMLGLGAVVAIGGIIYAVVARPDSQEGAGVQFAPPPGGTR